tara:strand:+ start:60 stop:290 length:231 start_codon:yes stop_codon:yes gene_type:complete
MKSEKIKDELKDIKMQLAYIRGMLENVNYQMQELRDDIGKSSYKNTKLPVQELYEHPWYKYKRKELISGGNYLQSS